MLILVWILNLYSTVNVLGKYIEHRETEKRKLYGKVICIRIAFASRVHKVNIVFNSDDNECDLYGSVATGRRVCMASVISPHKENN